MGHLIFKTKERRKNIRAEIEIKKAELAIIVSLKISGPSILCGLCESVTISHVANDLESLENWLKIEVIFGFTRIFTNPVMHREDIIVELRQILHEFARRLKKTPD